MNGLGLSAADLTVYGKALAANHSLKVEMRVLDLAGTMQTTLHPTINSGQINLDVDQDVTRSATMVVNDPNRSLQFDPDSPNDAALYFNRQIQIVCKVFVPALARWVNAPVFTGPLVKFDRTGQEVSLEAQGRESLALHGVPTMTLKRGHNAVDAIHDILYQRVGERRFSFPSLSHRLPKHLSVSWEEKTWPWTVCKKIAKSVGLHLYYDGAGICRLRDRPAHPVFTFHTGEGSNITSIVQVSHEKDNIRNRVKVIGSKPAHSWTAYLRNHPASPESLQINGVKQYWSADDITDSKIRSKAAAKKRAEVEIAKYAAMTFGNTFNAVPVPHLDEYDLVRIDAEEYASTEVLRQWSFPLTGGDMTVGFNDLVSLPRRNVRHA